MNSLVSSHVKRYASSNLFDECILVFSTWREATALLRWISALPPDKTNILQDFTQIFVKQDKLGDGSLTNTMQLHQEAHEVKKQGFSKLLQSAQKFPVQQIKNKEFSFRSDLTYLTHYICLISVEYDNHKLAKIISKISCKILIYKDKSKDFNIEGSDEKENIEGFYKFCKDNLAGKSATLVCFSVCNTIMMLIRSLHIHSMYAQFCDLFSSFTDLHTIMRNKCPEYKSRCQLPDFNWICNYLEVGAEFQKIEEVTDKMFHILQMLFEPTLHDSIQEDTCPVSMLFQSQNPVCATIKLQTELAFEDGETIQQIFNHSLGKHLDKLHVSESMHKHLKIKVLDLTKDILTLELTNVSTSMVLATGENIVKLFAYAEPFAIHCISNMAKNSVDKFRSLPVAPKESQEVNVNEHASTETDSNPIFGRSISMCSQRLLTKKLEIKADTEIILFPKQCKTIEMDFKELRTSPVCKVNIEKIPENKNFDCKLNDKAELVFGKLTFVVVSQTKAKLVLPVGHCFGYLHVDPNHTNVDDIKISVSSDPSRVDALESSQSVEEEDVEMSDVNDLDVSLSSIDLRNERNVIVRELENLDKSENTAENEPLPVENEIIEDDSNQETTLIQMNESAIDTNDVTLTEENSATMQSQSESKFIFSDKIPGYDDLIVAAKSYISNNRDNGIDNDTLEAIVYALQSLAVINSSFTTFKSIIEGLKKSSKFNKSHIISTLNTNSMNLFSKIMNEKFIGPFMSIVSHALSESCDQQIADSGDEISKDLTVTDTPGKGKCQLNTSFKLSDLNQALGDAKNLSPLSQKKKRKKRCRNKNKSPQLIRESPLSSVLNSGKTSTSENQLPPSLFDNPNGSSEQANQTKSLANVKNVVEQLPVSSVSTVASISASTPASSVNTTPSPTVSVTMISSTLKSSSSITSDKVTSTASNIKTKESDKNTTSSSSNKTCNIITSNTAQSALAATKTVSSNQNSTLNKLNKPTINTPSKKENSVEDATSKTVDNVDKTENQPEGSTNKVFKCNSEPKCSNAVPDPARYFINLHVGKVVTTTTTYSSKKIIGVKTSKGTYEFAVKKGFNVSIKDKVLLQLDLDEKNVKWYNKLESWNSMTNCCIGKVIEINPKFKVFIVEYKNGLKAKLNELRIKHCCNKNNDVKIGSLFWIYVYPKQPLVVSLGILKEDSAKSSEISTSGLSKTKKASSSKTSNSEIASRFTGIGALTYMTENLGILKTNSGSLVAFHKNILPPSLANKNLSTNNSQVKQYLDFVIYLV